MSETGMPASYYVKQVVVYGLVAISLLFGVKTCRSYQQKKRIVAELTAHVSESAAYEQFYADNAAENLYKAMLVMHRGAELGMTAPEMVDEVMMDESSGWFSTTEKPKLSSKDRLIRKSILSNYDNCRKLGIFSVAGNLTALAEGEAPVIAKGPMDGEEAVVLQIISKDAIDGVDKVLPNLLISPPPEKKKKATAPTAFEKKRAVELAGSLADAGLIDHVAAKKVVEYFTQLDLKFSAELKEETKP